MFSQDFDVVIIDEATQALEAVGYYFLERIFLLIYWPPMVRYAGSRYSRRRNSSWLAIQCNFLRLFFH